MPAVLDSSQSRKRVLPLSVAAYHYLGEKGLIPERVELIQGVILAKPRKSPLHVHLVRLLEELLRKQLPANFLLQKEDPLTFADSEPELDLAVICRNQSHFSTFHPATAELVIEVGVFTEDTDRAKAEIYAEAGVKEYWIVLPQHQHIKIYSQPSAARYGSHAVVTDVAASTVLPGFSVGLKELFAI